MNNSESIHTVYIVFFSIKQRKPVHPYRDFTNLAGAIKGTHDQSLVSGLHPRSTDIQKL